MTFELAEQDEVAAAIEGNREGVTKLHSLTLWMQDPDLMFNALKGAFEDGPPYSRARAMTRVWQKAIEATL